MLQVFVAGDDAAFEVYFDAIISDDDLFHQLLHDHAVICVHDCAALFSGSMTSPALSLTAVMISSASSIMSLIAAVYVFCSVSSFTWWLSQAALPLLILLEQPQRQLRLA